MKNLLFFFKIFLLIFCFSFKVFGQDLSNLLNLKNGLDRYLQIWTPPHTQIKLNRHSLQSQNAEATHFIFKMGPETSRATLSIEGPFGGIIEKDLFFQENPLQEIFISEERWMEDQNNPLASSDSKLPQLCPRLIPQKNIYDGSKDFFSYAYLKDQEILWLKKAILTFDFEDTSLLAGFDQEGIAHYEKGGGFYSNIHYVLFPYTEALENLFQKMEHDWIKLRKFEMEIAKANPQSLDKEKIEREMKIVLEKIRGKGEEVGPHALLMNLFFQTSYLLPDPKLASLYPAPIVHGFLPGPFLGSSHLGYNLCEWGDTAFHAPKQEMSYENYALGKWNKGKSDEKLILMLVEGDEQMKKNKTRSTWEQKAVLRKFDYADDLIAFFILSKKESQGKTMELRSPFGELQLLLESR